MADTVMKDPVFYLPSNIFTSTAEPEPVAFESPSIT